MDVTLGSFNLHMGRGTPGHAAPFYDVVAAAKEVDTDVLVVQEAWLPDDGDGNLAEIADALGYDVAAVCPLARGTCHDRVRLVARHGPEGDGDWAVAILSRLPVRRAALFPLEPQFARDPSTRALLLAVVEVDGTPFTVTGTHLPVLKHPVWQLTDSIRAALPSPAEPAAFAGDMNMWGWCIDRLAPEGWRRAVRGRTYPSHRPHSQIDHILVTDPVEVVNAEVLPQRMSDHRPIRAHLRF